MQNTNLKYKVLKLHVQIHKTLNHAQLNISITFSVLLFIFLIYNINIFHLIAFQRLHLAFFLYKKISRYFILSCMANKIYTINTTFFFSVERIWRMYKCKYWYCVYSIHSKIADMRQIEFFSLSISRSSLNLQIDNLNERAVVVVTNKMHY